VAAYRESGRVSDLPRPAVVYLARAADGLGPVRRFAESFRAYPPGGTHDLVVIYKGYNQQADLNHASDAFSGIEHRAIELPDVGFDMGAYFECAKRISNRYLVFLNTHCEIAAGGWLAVLSRYGLDEGVGIAGATGSYESLNDSVEILKDVLRKCAGVGRTYDARVAYYFDFLLRRHHRSWYSSAGDVVQPRRGEPAGLRKSIALGIRLLYDRWVALRGTSLIWPGAPRFDTHQFPRFPNPHIRSNAFMVRRDRWLQMAFLPRRKLDTSLFESGPDSFTAQIRQRGLATLIVGQDGTAYDVSKWPHSRTFRLGNQGNLLVHDNHTRSFEAMSHGARTTHAWMTWGDSLTELPPDFPLLRSALRADSSATIDGTRR